MYLLIIMGILILIFGVKFKTDRDLQSLHDFDEIHNPYAYCDVFYMKRGYHCKEGRVQECRNNCITYENQEYECIYTNKTTTLRYIRVNCEGRFQVKEKSDSIKMGHVDNVMFTKTIQNGCFMTAQRCRPRFYLSEGYFFFIICISINGVILIGIYVYEFTIWYTSRTINTVENTTNNIPINIHTEETRSTSPSRVSRCGDE